jgi:hypothetical protein
LHPLSRLKQRQGSLGKAMESGKKEVLKNFLKKVSKKFGGLKKTLYLCTTFALIKQRGAKTERLGQRSNQIECVL